VVFVLEPHPLHAFHFRSISREGCHYQPAQKWLKDRKGRELSADDIIHYQKIVTILNETDRIMKEIG
jgi:hypothetical protein